MPISEIVIGSEAVAAPSLTLMVKGSSASPTSARTRVSSGVYVQTPVAATMLSVPYAPARLVTVLPPETMPYESALPSASVADSEADSPGSGPLASSSRTTPPLGAARIGVSLTPVIKIVRVREAVSAPSPAVTVKASVASDGRALMAVAVGVYVQVPALASITSVPYVPTSVVTVPEPLSMPYARAVPSASVEVTAPVTVVNVSEPAVSTMVAPVGTGMTGRSLTPTIEIVKVAVPTSEPSEAVTVKASEALVDSALIAAASGT